MQYLLLIIKKNINILIYSIFNLNYFFNILLYYYILIYINILIYIIII